MKLRLQANTVRLRLKQSEVANLVKCGVVEETITFAAGPAGTLRYVLESSAGVNVPHAIVRDNTVLIQVPEATVKQGASSDEVSIEATQKTVSEPLRILVEKDFACLDGSDEQNADTFPNPLAGTKC